MRLLTFNIIAVVVFFAGLIPCFFIYRKCIKYRTKRIDMLINYSRDAYHTHNEILVHPTNANFASVFFAWFSFWVVCLTAGNDCIEMYLGYNMPIYLLFSVFCVLLLLFLPYNLKQVILLSNRSFIIIFHSYKKKETCIPYRDIMNYKYKRRLLRIETKSKYYYFDYNHVNFSVLLKRLQQERIPQKESLF